MAKLLTLDATPASWMLNIAAGGEAGLDPELILGNPIAIAPVIGSSKNGSHSPSYGRPERPTQPHINLFSSLHCNEAGASSATKSGTSAGKASSRIPTHRRSYADGRMRVWLFMFMRVAFRPFEMILDSQDLLLRRLEFGVGEYPRFM